MERRSAQGFLRDLFVVGALPSIFIEDDDDDEDSLLSCDRLALT